MNPMQDAEAVQRVYDIGVGRYDVTVDIGPPYKTRRQEAVDSQLQFLKLLPPEMAHMFLDLVTANMDWPQAKEFAARAKKLLPAQLQDDGPTPQAQIEQLKQHASQTAQQLQMVMQELQKAQQVIQMKQVEMQSKERIEKMKIEADIAIAEINTKAQDASERRQFEMDMWKLTHDSAHDVAMQSQQQQHEVQQQQSQQDAAVQQQQAASQQQQPDNSTQE